MRLRQLVATEGVPATQPVGNLSALETAAGAPWAALATTTEALGKTAQHVSDQYLLAQNALAKEDRKLNLMETLSALKDEYAAREVATKSTLGSPEGVDPTQYDSTMRSHSVDLLKTYEGKLKYPDTAPAFREQALPFLTEQGIKARHEGLKIQQANLETRDEVLLDRAAQQAVMGSSKMERDTALATGLDIVQSGVNSGRYSGGQGGTKLTGFLRSVDRGSAMRDFRNPDLRQSVIDRLVTGDFSRQMSAEEQFTLAHTMQTQFDTEQRLKDTKAEADAKKMRDTVTQDLFLRSRDTDVGARPTDAEIEQKARQWGLTVTEIRDVVTARDKPPVEPPSNPAVRARVSGDVNSMHPKMSEMEIKQLYIAGALNTADRDEFLAKRTARITHEQEYGHSLAMQEHAQAEQSIKAALGIPDIMDKIDDPRMPAWAAALRALTDRSNAYKGQEAPLALAPEIIARYKQMLGDRGQVDFETANKLANYKTMTELEAARSTMTSGRYREERELTQRLVDMRNENLRLSGQGQPPKYPPAGGGGAPKKPAAGGTPTYGKGSALPEMK